ncbi:hypothetical protein I4U23_013390 [Adineta vaga]|nr:hypothetical protein I4U23_013390 [Adineta vaga]
MISGKSLLCVLIVMLVIQAEVSLGSSNHHDELQTLLMQALKLGDCARVVPVNEPLPLRFRRTPNHKQFQCIITLK